MTEASYLLSLKNSKNQSVANNGISFALYDVKKGGVYIVTVLRCSDMGVQCNWIGRAETEQELFKMASEHAATVHGMKEIPKELLAKAKTLIRDEK